MLLRILNSIAAVFGYQWVIDKTANHGEEDLIADEGYDLLEDNTTHYKLTKLANKEEE